MEEGRVSDGSDPLDEVRATSRLYLDGRKDEARAQYVRIWEAARTAGDDDVGVHVAHLLGVFEPMPAEEKLTWHLASLECMQRVQDERAKGWYASIYGNLGYVHRLLGRTGEALSYYERAQVHAEALDDSPYARGVRADTAKALAELRRPESSA